MPAAAGRFAPHPRNSHARPWICSPLTTLHGASNRNDARVTAQGRVISITAQDHSVLQLCA